MGEAQRMLKVKLTRSPIGCPPRQRATLRALALRRVGKTVIVKDSPAVRGMLRAVAHLVTVEE